MKQEEIIKQLTNKLNHLKKIDFYDYFPNIIEDLDYMSEKLWIDMKSLSEEEQVDSRYEINELVISYFMEVIKIYWKEIYHEEVDYSFDELLSIGGCAAYDGKKERVLISVIGLMIQAINTMSYMQPLLHELRHKKQHDFYKEDKIENMINYPAYFLLIEKHYLYMKKHKNDSFYLENYTNLYPELDAEENSVNKLEEIIPTLCGKYQEKRTISEELKEKIILLQRRIQEDTEQIKEDLKEKGRIQTSISQELLIDNPINSFFTEEGRLVDSLVAVDFFLKSHPELQEEYPILKLLWNNNHPKSYQELIVDKKNLLESFPNHEINVFGITTTTHHQIEEFYQVIIKSDPILQIEEWQETNQKEKIEEYLKNHPTILEKYSKEIQELFLKPRQKRKSLT